MAPKGELKRRVKLSNPRGDTGKISNNIEPIRGNLKEHLYKCFIWESLFGFLKSKSEIYLDTVEALMEGHLDSLLFIRLLSMKG